MSVNDQQVGVISLCQERNVVNLLVKWEVEKNFINLTTKLVKIKLMKKYWRNVFLFFCWTLTIILLFVRPYIVRCNPLIAVDTHIGSPHGVVIFLIVYGFCRQPFGFRASVTLLNLLLSHYLTETVLAGNKMLLTDRSGERWCWNFTHVNVCSDMSRCTCSIVNIDQFYSTVRFIYLFYMFNSAIRRSTCDRYILKYERKIKCISF